MRRARVARVFYSIALATLAACGNEPLPAWVNEAIEERQASISFDVIEESTYDGARAFLLILGDRADTGDEHILFAEDGREICQFGGFVGRVTAGACDLEKIVYRRTLFAGGSQ
jgi:hypothetical protein